MRNKDIQSLMNRIHDWVAGEINAAYREGYTDAKQDFEQTKQKPAIGWRIVPTEPTIKMVYAGCEAAMVSRSETARLYRAMLASAPKYEEQK